MPCDPTEKPGGAAWRALFLVSLCYIGTMYLRACPAILAPDLQAAFGVNAAGVTMFSSAALLGYGLMQMPAGLITDAIGGRKTLALFMVLAAFSTLVFALAPNLELGAAARFIAGLSMAAVPPLGAILALYFPRDRYTQAMGLVMASGGLGSILAAEPLARLSIALGWRGAMLASALFMAALGLCVFFIIREAKKEGAVRARSGAREELAAIGRGMRRVFRSAQYWYLAIWQIFSSVVFFSFMSMWAGPYLMEAYGLDKLAASRIMFVQGLGALALVPALSALVDKLNSRRGGLIICASLGLAGSLGISHYAGALPIPLLTACIMTMPICGLAGATCVFSLIRRNFPPELTGTGIGCVNMFWPVFAALLSELIGVVLVFFLDGAAPADLPQASVASAYCRTFYIYVGCYLGALILPIFLIKENFSLDGPRPEA